MSEQKNFGIKNYTVNNLINSSAENIARIIQKNNHLYTIATVDKIISKVKIGHKLIDKDFYVGDFVVFYSQEDDYFIKELLERKNIISKASSHAAKSYHVPSYEQILATNVDQLYIVIAADQRFTLSKFERYIMTFNQDNMEMNILLSKADFLEETMEIKKMIHSSYPKAKVTSVSMHQPETIQQVKNSLSIGQTAMFIGASGVGKSTLINELLNSSSEDTNPVKPNGKGKHTTTVTKMLYFEETESLLIDSPGFKTISTTKGMDGSILFEEIQNLGKYCKFNDCTHNHEPGCAVIRATEHGEISTEQLDRYSLYEKKLRGLQKHENLKLRKKLKKPNSKK